VAEITCAVMNRHQRSYKKKRGSRNRDKFQTAERFGSMRLICLQGAEAAEPNQIDKQMAVFFPLTITVTEMSVNGNTSIQLTLTIIITKIHAKTVT
jgi:hypothetical protein